jgi:predicted PurR-regulated permease PerM
MSQPDLHAPSPALRQVLLGILLGMLAVLCAAILRPFVASILWATIVAYASWPAYHLVLRLCRGHSTPAALLMTTLVTTALIVPLLALTLLLQNELTAVHQAILRYRGQSPPGLAALLRTIPWLGDRLQGSLDRYLREPLLLRQVLVDWAWTSHGTLFGIGRALSRNVAKLLIALLTVYFFYRDGEALARRLALVLQRYFDDRLDPYIRAAGAMTRAVVFGILVTAFVQGGVAGIGYALFGVDAPVLLGAVTALASVVPIFGTFLVWGAVSTVLLLTGHVWHGLGLMAWGIALVHPADNLIRPLLISNATHMPFLLVMFGVLGGLTAFGLVGLFIGPVALAIAYAVWQEWLAERGHAHPPRNAGAPPARAC